MFPVQPHSRRGKDPTRNLSKNSNLSIIFPPTFTLVIVSASRLFFWSRLPFPGPPGPSSQVRREDSQFSGEESSGRSKYSKWFKMSLFPLQFTKELHQNEKNLPEALSLEAIIRPHSTILQIIALKKEEIWKEPLRMLKKMVRVTLNSQICVPAGSKTGLWRCFEH